MGYGEVGGGGSVDWVVVHGDSNGGVRNGRDKVPGKGGKFVLVVNGVKTEFDIKNDPAQIQIYWTPHNPDNVHTLTTVIEEARQRNKAAAAEGV